MRLDLRSLTRRVAGLLWVAAWIVVLHQVFAPWADLGGVVTERLRWLERLVLFSGPVIGFALAATARDLVRPRRLRSYFGLVRLLLYPAALVTAAGGVALAVAGHHDAVGVVLTGCLSYWAGIDFALGAGPLLEGRRPLDPARDASDPASSGDAGPRSEGSKRFG